MRSFLVVLLAAVGVLAAASAAQAQAPTSVALQTARVGSATLGYRDLNATAGGTPLVLITGYGVTAAEWDPTFVQTLAADRRVIVFDNRGMGNSTGPVRGLTIRTMARDTAGLVSALRLGRVDVLGWSMGGYIAQRLAIDRPGLVRRLVLASTDPGSRHSIPPSASVLRTLTDPSGSPTALLPILFPADQQAAGTAWITAIGEQPGLTAADFATPAATMTAQTRAVRLYGRGAGSYGQLSRIKAPTWVGYGTQDVVVPPANARLLTRRIAHATAHPYPDAGHAFLFQDPVAKATAIATFLGGAGA